MNLDDALLTFFAESRGLLEEMEEALLRLEDTPDDAEALNAVFRAAHTIKGSAGLFGLDAVVAFTHVAESVLDRARSGELAVDEQLIGLFLACRDHMGLLIDAVADGSLLSQEQTAAGKELIARLSALLSNARPQAAALPAEMPAMVTREGGFPLSGDLWHLSLRFGQESLRDGMDPLSILRYLGGLGDIVHMVTVSDALPDATEMDPEACYLGFEIGFRSQADKARIEAAFEFVREDSLIRILPPGSRTGDYLRLIEELPENKTRLGELLVASGALTQTELEEMLREQASAPEHPPLGSLLVEQGLVQPELVGAALAKQQEARNRQAREAASVRVQADKLDQLINLVGELVISGAGVGMLARRYNDGAMQEAVSGLANLVEEIRDGALRLRMVEIGETFNRFRRVVRDVSKDLGKEVELVVRGADTELDKTVVERIGDPLTHLVRNAMDHGLESPDKRIALGKPAQGRLTLNAYHESGGIVIEVSDDGRGLDRERILAKARERGLIEDGHQLSDIEVWNLIFEPGFSTAEQVSNLSGRGVGMDVVKRNIEALRGTVEIV
ncbi:MAG: chemotaxis protein CheA, partial [Zoogloea sp.]|nr:chemotaxis protein CheA [Zoogloea sp.]